MTDARHHLGNGFFGGWNPQRPDHRDRPFTTALSLVPDRYELPGIAQIPKINQANQGACVGHGCDGVMMYDEYKQGLPVTVRSRAMIYYNARIPEGTTGSDSGAAVRDGVAGLARWGACTEAQFPYDPNVWDRPPSEQNYTEGAHQEALVYEAVRFPHINAAIASGFPVVDGMTVFSSMMSAEVAATGIVPRPGGPTVGGHCTWTFGFNATDEWWTSPSGLAYPPFTKAKRNSWLMPDGSWWGADGNFFLPQAYWSEGLVTDSWVIRRIGPK